MRYREAKPSEIAALEPLVKLADQAAQTDGVEIAVLIPIGPLLGHQVASSGIVRVRGDVMLVHGADKLRSRIAIVLREIATRLEAHADGDALQHYEEDLLQQMAAKAGSSYAQTRAELEQVRAVPGFAEQVRAMVQAERKKAKAGT
jgi:hypothetical protein